MALGNWGRLGLANSSPDPVHRSMATGMAALLAGAAAIALFTPSAHAQSANAQQAAQPATDQQAEQAQTPEQPAAAGATLLDQILVVSRTGETAIDSLASVSHIDQEQLRRRMATTPNDMLLGVPGVRSRPTRGASPPASTSVACRISVASR